MRSGNVYCGKTKFCTIARLGLHSTTEWFWKAYQAIWRRRDGIPRLAATEQRAPPEPPPTRRRLKQGDNALVAADSRARRTNVRHDHASETGGVGARGDDVALEFRLRRHAVRTHGLPERIAGNLAGAHADIAPALLGFELGCGPGGEGLRGLGGVDLRIGAGSCLDQLAAGFGRSRCNNENSENSKYRGNSRQRS